MLILNGLRSEVPRQGRCWPGGSKSKKQQALRRVGTAEFQHEDYPGIAWLNTKEEQWERDQPDGDGELQTRNRISLKYTNCQFICWVSFERGGKALKRPRLRVDVGNSGDGMQGRKAENLEKRRVEKLKRPGYKNRTARQAIKFYALQADWYTNSIVGRGDSPASIRRRAPRLK